MTDEVRSWCVCCKTEITLASAPDGPVWVADGAEHGDLAPELCSFNPSFNEVHIPHPDTLAQMVIELGRIERATR